MRGEATTQLLAKALVDLQVSYLLFQAAEDQAHGATPTPRDAVQRSPTSTISVEEPLAIILGEWQHALPDRGPSLPNDIPSSQSALNEKVADVIVLVEKRAARTGQAALGNLLTIGIGQLGQAAALVSLDIAQAFGAATELSRLYTLFREFFASAYHAIITALGPTVAQIAANHVLGWVNEITHGQKFVELLEKAYQTADTRARLEEIVLTSSAAVGSYHDALYALDALNNQFAKQMEVLEKVETALRFLTAVPVAAMPQARLLLGATHIAITGYAIFAGADAVDAPLFARLDRLPGPARILTETIGQQLSMAEPPPEPAMIEPEPEAGYAMEEGEEPSASPPQRPSAAHTPSASRGPSRSPRPGRASTSSPASGQQPAGVPSPQESPPPVDDELIEEKIRIDLAVPEAAVVVGETFEIAVAIHRPKSAKLQVEGMGSVTSGDGTVYRRKEDELVRYRVSVAASNCSIDTSSYTFQLRAGRDSEPCFFQLTPTRAGTIRITVTAYQEDDLLVGQTRRQLQAVVQSIQPSSTSREGLVNQLEKKKPARKDRKGKTKKAPERQYLNFDIFLHGYKLSKKGRETFKVNVQSGLVRDIDLNHPDRVTIPPDLRQKLRMLDNRALIDDEIVQLGRQLGDLLLPEKARRYFDQSQKALQENQALRIRIKTGDYPLASIPWEYVFIPPDGDPNFTGEQGFLALDKRFSLVRYEMLGKRVKELPSTSKEKLRLVMLLADPHLPGYAELQLDQEEKNVRDALKQVSGIDLDVFPNATLQDLEDAFIDSVQIFHFAGHGTFEGELGAIRDTQTGMGCILLNEPNPEDSLFPASRLAATLKDCGVRLAVLGVCESGERDAENAWTGIAAALSYSEIPAVVAMQFRVLDKSAIAFHRAFYRTLSAGHSIDLAVANGRQAIANRTKRDRDWGVPVLYLRTDGQSILFDS